MNWYLENERNSSRADGEKTFQGGSICRVLLVWNSKKDPFGNCKSSHSRAEEMAEMDSEALLCSAEDLNRCFSIIVYLVPKQDWRQSKALRLYPLANREPQMGFGPWNVGWSDHVSVLSLRRHHCFCLSHWDLPSWEEHAHFLVFLQPRLQNKMHGADLSLTHSLKLTIPAIPQSHEKQVNAYFVCLTDL